MSRRILFTAGAALLALGSFAARPASAEDESEGDLRQKIQKQMEKILQLMRENEKALLVASSGGEADPTSPEVVVPPGEASKESGEKPSGEPSGGAAGGDPGTRGEEIRRRLEEVLSGQGAKSRAIPRELEELVKMIPT
jgi:hypothetical protein